MLPVTHGEHYTKVHILLYTLMMFAVTLLPWRNVAQRHRQLSCHGRRITAKHPYLN
jgi:heme O synthase-like polyprenyltransferase